MINEDAVIACAKLVGRAGARDFQIGYLHDDVPAEEAGWYATAFYQGMRISADDHKSPTLAATALAERLLRGAMCRCLKPVSLADTRPGCRWRLVGADWKPGCDVPPITVKGQPGDYSAMVEAVNQRARRQKP